MRKIKLLLVAVFALIGMSAFAQAPGYGDQGYLYDAVGNKFINAEGKVGSTGMEFKVVNPNKSQYTTADSRKFDQYRFKVTSGANYGLGFDNSGAQQTASDNKKYNGNLFNGLVTSTGNYGYGVFAVVPKDKGFLIMCTYTYAWGENVNLKKDNCLGYKEDGTLCFFPEDEAPIWQLIDQETYDLLTTGLSTNVPANDAVGYLFAPSAMKFIAGDVEVGSKKQAVTGITGIKFKAINDGGKYRFETELKQSEDSNEGGKNKGKATRLSRCENQTDNSITTTQYYGWSKWTVKVVDGQGFRLANGYGSGQGKCIAIEKDKTLTLVTEAEAPCWIFVDQDAYDKLSAVLIEEPESEPEPEPVIEFPGTGAKGYLYNPAANLFINKDAKLAAKGDAVTIINEGANGDFINLRFEFSAGNRLNFNGESGMSGTGTSYAKFAVKETEKGIIMTHAYPNPDNPAWMKAQNLTGTYMVANGEELGFKALEEIGEYGYWQFVDQETYEKILEILASEPLIKPLLNASPLATDGTTKQYLYNLKAKGFLVGANDWGTRASISTDEGILFSVQDNGDGTYALVSPRGTVGVDGGNSWIDSNGRFQEGYTINFNEDGTFTIGNTAVGGYLSLDPSKADDTRLYFTTEATNWIAVSEADYAKLTAYTAACNSVVDAYKESSSTSSINNIIKYNSVAELNGVSFSIINEADGKAVYGSNAQNLAYDTYDKAFASSNSGYKYTLEAIDGGYLVRLMTPSGSPYSVWGNPGYVNSGAPGGFNGCFVLGLNNQNGTDVANGAVWEIEYVEGKGFTMKNKALGGYFAGNSPAPSGTDPIYWTFGDFISLYEEYLAALNAIEKIDPNSLTESQQAKLQALLSKYAVNKVLNSIATEGSINVAIEALNVFGKEIQLTNLIAEAKDCLNEEMSSAVKENLNAVIEKYDGVEFESLKDILDATDAVNEAIAAANASAGIYADYRNALAAAKEILPETMPAGVLVALDKAIKDYPESKVLTADATEESINAAATTLWNAYNAAKAAVDNAKALMGMYELMENNNVVTPEAYDIYMGKFEEYSKQWKAGTLTEAVESLNPYSLRGVRTDVDFDDYLLSAWTEDGVQCANYDQGLIINSWSTEGIYDGTEFKVPFFEYWTSDPNTLAAKEFEATLTDLPSGIYEVTAWVRVRTTNGTDPADAEGVVFQVNEDDEVDVTNGEVVGQFNLTQVKEETIVQDGTLKVKFNVAEGNNISWLSFQNVKYTLLEEIATAISEVSNKAAAKSVFNVAGQQLAAPAKGLNIIDGKKVYIK